MSLDMSEDESVDDKLLEVRIRNLESVLPEDRVERAKAETTKQLIEYGDSDNAFKKLYHKYLREQYLEKYPNKAPKKGSN